MIPDRALGFGALVILASTLWLAAVAYPQAAPPRPATPSPHGSLAGECTTCHTAEGWTPLRDPLGFAHEGTGFPLVAAHAQASCRDCHRSLVFANVGTACADCHRDAHRGELGTGCGSCHTPESWSNRQEFFRVHNRTRFPLLAAHARLDCESCHRGQQPREFIGTPTDCVACHLADYRAAEDPDHERLRLSRQCDTCHTMAASSWQGGTFGGSFPHPETFPLRAAHAQQPCASCHAGGFTGTSRECVSCHRDDFDRATDPNHRAGGFSTGCQGCHGDAAWEPATFDHAVAGFPLTGAHARADCGSCHEGGRFTGTSSQCVSCHRAEFDRSTNPDHAAAGFPTTCQSCHGTNGWRPATFDHSRFFPLVDKHRDLACGSCHASGGSFRSFQCLTCHDRPRMDDKHRRVGGYRYDSPSCYACHPRGEK